MPASSVRAFVLRVVASESLKPGDEIRLEAAVTVGRERTAGLWLDDRSVSRQHAQLEPAQDGVRVRDLGSGNGVWMGAERISDRQIAPGQQFRIGATVFEVRSGPGEVPSLAPVGPTARGTHAAADAPPRTGGLALRVVEGSASRPGRPHLPRHRRSRPRSAARRRATSSSARRTSRAGTPASSARPEGLRIVDLDSAGGVWVGTEAVKNRVLQPGERVRLGRAIVLEVVAEARRRRRVPALGTGPGGSARATAARQAGRAAARAARSQRRPKPAAPPAPPPLSKPAVPPSAAGASTGFGATAAAAGHAAGHTASSAAAREARRAATGRTAGRATSGDQAARRRAAAGRTETAGPADRLRRPRASRPRPRRRRPDRRRPRRRRNRPATSATRRSSSSRTGNTPAPDRTQQMRRVVGPGVDLEGTQMLSREALGDAAQGWRRHRVLPPARCCHVRRARARPHVRDAGHGRHGREGAADRGGRRADRGQRAPPVPARRRRLGLLRRRRRPADLHRRARKGRAGRPAHALPRHRRRPVLFRLRPQGLRPRLGLPGGAEAGHQGAADAGDPPAAAGAAPAAGRRCRGAARHVGRRAVEGADAVDGEARRTSCRSRPGPSSSSIAPTRRPAPTAWCGSTCGAAASCSTTSARWSSRASAPSSRSRPTRGSGHSATSSASWC